MFSDAEADMVAHWAALLANEGFAADELAAASEWLVVHDPPKWRDKHCDRLKERVLSQRVLSRSVGPRPDDPGTCCLCGGSGMVSVPGCAGLVTRSGATLDGAEPWSLFAVLCRCALGRWLRPRQGDENRRLTLDDYEKLNPDWRQQLERRGRLLRQRGEVGDLTRSVDAVLGALKTKREVKS